MSADKSPDLQLADSTVVKILPAINNYVMITFSYDNNRAKVSSFEDVSHDNEINFIFSLFLSFSRLILKQKWSIRSLCMVRDGRLAIPRDQCRHLV